MIHVETDRFIFSVVCDCGFQLATYWYGTLHLRDWYRCTACNERHRLTPDMLNTPEILTRSRNVMIKRDELQRKFGVRIDT